MARLIYETTDSDFAERAVEALLEAQIQCYCTGISYSKNYVPKGQAPLCIFITDDNAYSKASGILLGLGAAPDQAAKIPTRWVVVLVVLVAFAMVVLALTQSK